MGWPMQRIVTRILSCLAFLGAAVLAALALARFAHDVLGLSSDTVRTDAMFLALVLTGLFIIVVFSGRFGRRGR